MAAEDDGLGVIACLSGSGASEPMYIDVIVLTKNSEYILEGCLNSIYSNIPINNLIVIDDFSTDSTLSILNDFDKKYGNVRIVEKNGSRAIARELGIKNAETEWFLFVDSDVVLCNGWYKKASKNMGDDVGAIWGLNIDVIQNFNSKTFYRLFMHVSREAFKIRGCMTR